MRKAGNDLTVDLLDPGTESKERRMTELKLLHHYLTKTCGSFLFQSREPDGTTPNYWAMVGTSAAIGDEALLYSILSIASLHMAKTEKTNLDAVGLHEFYLDMVLQLHKGQIADLNHSTANSACMTSSILRVIALAMLSERVTQPYEPPMQWLQITSSAGTVFKAAWRWIKDDPDGIAMKFINRKPLLTPYNESLFLESYRQNLLPLLQRDETRDSEEPWGIEIYNAYATTLSYIGGIFHAIREGERSSDTGRRLVAFAVLIPTRFVELVGESRPRALVMLAYFFAILSRFQDVWYLGDTGCREVVSLSKSSVIPTPWQKFLHWPLQAVRNGSMAAQEPNLS